MSQTQWSLHPLLYATLPNEVCESIFADIVFFRFVILLALLLSTTYPIAHKVLLKISREYNAIEISKKQLVVVHHAVEGVVLSVVFPFFSYYMIRTLFQVHELDELKYNVRAVGLCAMNFILMYVLELASRFEEPRPILIFHHVLTCLDGLFLFFSPTSIIIKTAIILLYFICFEALTFIGLFMYRIFPNSAMTPKVIYAGMVSFGITRPLQLLMILAAVIGSWNDEYVAKWQAIVQVIVACIMTMIQIFTLKIHYGIWKRCISRQQQGKNSIVDVTSSSSHGEVDSDCSKMVDHDVDEEKCDGSGKPVTRNDDRE